MDKRDGSHRTRSKAAPDWTIKESIDLVNEINAVELEWGGTLPSFQRWQQIVENCNALDVNRNLNQCKRHWDTLLGDYRRVKDGAGANGSFPVELFEAVDSCVNARGKKYGGDGGAEVSEGGEEEETGMDTGPDSDPEEQDQVTEVLLKTGSKKQRRRMKRKKIRVERPKPWGYFTSPMINHQEFTTSNIHEKLGNVNNNITDQEKTVDKEKIMAATILWENALQINTILDESREADDTDSKLTNLKNSEVVETDFTRRQGDKLIDCLGKISATLNQLCDLVREH